MKKKLFVHISVLLGIIVVNFFATIYFFRIDLTQDKRYTLSEASKNLLENLSKKDSANDIFIKVYLDGEELPGGFERLKRAVQENLEDFKAFGGNNINYTFIDPNAEANSQKREALFLNLAKKGLSPTRIVDNKNGRQIENIIFPYAIVSSGGKEVPVLLLKGTQGKTAEEKLNQSCENVEYELVSAIRKLTISERKKIGLLTEFTDLKPIYFSDLIATLQERYDLFIIDAKKSPTFQGLDALILPKPNLAIDDSTKFKIDQFIMNGGRGLFFVDGLQVDSISLEGNFAKTNDLNLSDLFFKYGVRINPNLVKDGINCAMIPMVVGDLGDKPNIQPMPFRFFPLTNHIGNNLITNNLDLVLTKYPSNIDTVRADGIKKTPLLITSPYTKLVQAPTFIAFNDAAKETDPKDYQSGTQTIAYLLEGKFQSLYKSSFLGFGEVSKNFKATGEESKIIICADGDIIVNDFSNKTGNPYPMGYDKTTQHIFGNKDFVMNAIDYLIDENGVIQSKAKEVQLRPIDKIKAREDRSFWQIINIVLPVTLVLFLGLIINFWRKNIYSKNKI